MRHNVTIPAIAAVLTFAIHLVANAHYGFFRDELYFIICGLHPQFGYVDQPPLVPLLAAATQMAGHSLILLRAVPALFAAAAVYTTGLLVLEIGGGMFAQILACLVVFFADVLMSFGMKVSTDEVGLWTWTLIALLVTRIVKGGSPRLWLWAGVAAGISLQSKYSVIFFLAALVIGLLLTPARRVLFSGWFVAGCAIMIAIVLPNLAWQWANGFPMLELLRNGAHEKNVIAGPLLYLVQEILITNPFLAVIWIIGLVYLFASRQFRFLAFAYVVLIAQMILLHGKHYYPAAIYPVLIAGGAIAIENWTRRIAVLRIATVAYITVFGLVFLPFALPVLSEDNFIAYSGAISEAMHISQKTLATERGRESAALPGDWADMHGWPQLAQAVQSVYNGLTPADRARTSIVASNYGEAAAIDFFDAGLGLPPALSGHNQYFLWGTRGQSGDIVIDIHGDCGAAAHLFRESTLALTFTSRYAVSYEKSIPIMLCRGLKVPLAQLWPKLKMYI
jgi:hypothetical protein